MDAVLPAGACFFEGADEGSAALAAAVACLPLSLRCRARLRDSRHFRAFGTPCCLLPGNCGGVSAAVARAPDLYTHTPCWSCLPLGRRLVTKAQVQQVTRRVQALGQGWVTTREPRMPYLPVLFSGASLSLPAFPANARGCHCASPRSNHPP